MLTVIHRRHVCQHPIGQSNPLLQELAAILLNQAALTLPQYRRTTIAGALSAIVEAVYVHIHHVELTVANNLVFFAANPIRRSAILIWELYYSDDIKRVQPGDHDRSNTAVACSISMMQREGYGHGPNTNELLAFFRDVHDELTGGTKIKVDRVFALEDICKEFFVHAFVRPS